MIKGHNWFLLQGHSHRKILIALIDQAQTLTLSSRAFYNDKFPVFPDITKMFGYDRVLPKITSSEGVESAIKLARKRGYEKKQFHEYQVMSYKSLLHLRSKIPQFLCLM